MWEQIQSNKRKTWVLVILMGAVLVGLGLAIGAAYNMPEIGLTIALLVWGGMSMAAWFQGDNILLHMSGAQKIDHAEHPVLWNVVEEMKIASSLEKMPDIYIVNDMSPNAFAVGRDPDKAAVAVTAGLLGKLNRDELQGVIAHEIGHIVNRDVLLMTMLATTLGTVSIISEIFLRSLWYSGSSRRYSSRSSKDSNGGNQVMIVVAVACAVLAPMAAQLIYFAVSRRREYLADAQAAVYTRYPEGLASALEKISGASKPVDKASKATAAMYIVNPFAKVKLSALSATHPPAQDRIKILRGIGNVASYNAYQQAWKSVGGKAVGLPKSALSDNSAADVREASPEGSKKKSQREQLREAGDMVRQFNQFIFLSCICGMKFKVPPEFNHDAIPCPKCQRSNPLPHAQIHVAAEALGGSETAAASASAAALLAPGVRGAKVRKNSQRDADPITVPRGNSKEWVSFKCPCGKTKSLSPTFEGNKCNCGTCGQPFLLS
jgi:heat shock protein HtpX